MTTIADVRHRNLELILTQFPSPAKLASHLGVSGSQLSQLRTQHNNIGEKLARKIESKCDLQHGWMDTEQSTFSLESSPSGGQLSARATVLTLPARASGIQNAVVETAHRLVSAGLLNDMDCLALLQSWQPLIAKLNKKPAED